MRTSYILSLYFMLCSCLHHNSNIFSAKHANPVLDTASNVSLQHFDYILSYTQDSLSFNFNFNFVCLEEGEYQQNCLCATVLCTMIKPATHGPTLSAVSVGCRFGGQQWGPIAVRKEKEY